MYNIYTLFYLQAKSDPQYPALVFKDKVITYLTLSRRINATASALKKIGVGANSRVAILFPNSPVFVTLFYACQKLGAIIIPVNWRLHSNEISEVLQECSCSFFFYDKIYQAAISSIEINLDHTIVFAYTEGKTDDVNDLAALIHNGDEDWDYSYYPAPEDEALYVMSSGSTGKPKMLIHTHQSLIFTVLLRNLGLYGLYKGDVFLNYSALFHFGGINFMIGILSAGATFILLDSFRVDDIIQTIDKWKVTHLFIIPSSLCTSIKQSPLHGQKDLTSVRCALLGGTIVTAEAIADSFDIFTNQNFIVINGYGTTENGITTMFNLTREMCKRDDPLLKSIGKPVSLSLVKLVDDYYEEVAAGETGEALGWSPCQFKGYLGRPQSFWDGWVMTGDLLRQDKDGYYYFADRKKDMIRTAGENVYSYELEKVFFRHPAIKNCAVFGVPHAQLGEAIVAAVQLRETMTVSEDDLINFCKSHIASYKKPQKIVFPDTMPQTAVGKVDKKELRRIYAHLFSGT
jgi:acyl-CoA synthetase (AMP-forming)/AMP-acid ligase II